MNHISLVSSAALASLLFASITAAAASAQTLSWSVRGATWGANLGSSLDLVPDFDGDGADDILVGAPRSKGPDGRVGAVEVLSGRTGQTLLSFGGIDRFLLGPLSLSGQNRRLYHGSIVRCLGDVNGDGRTDFAISSPTETVSLAAYAAGRVHVHSGANGLRLYSVNGRSAYAEFGSRLDALGDINGDGHGDFIVGASRHDAESSSGVLNNAGAAYVISGRDGSSIYEYEGQFSFSRLGRAVGGLGDVDADGVNDFTILTLNSTGVTGPSPTILRVHSGATGLAIYELDIDALDAGAVPRSLFGETIRRTGDLDGDGTEDFVIGDSSGGSGITYPGAVFVFSGRTGRVIRTHAGVTTYEFFGADVRADLDLDGDGVRDLVIGNPGQQLTGPGYPRVHAYSGRTGAFLFEFTSQPLTYSFGRGLVVGDFSGDGVADVAVSSPWTGPPLLGAGLLEMYTR